MVVVVISGEELLFINVLTVGYIELLALKFEVNIFVFKGGDVTVLDKIGIVGNEAWNKGNCGWILCAGIEFKLIGKIGATVAGNATNEGSIKRELGVVLGRIDELCGLVKTFLIK